jgi:hypothetical protein
MFGSYAAEIALVSNAIPPGQTGYHYIVEQLLGAIPESKLATVGPHGPWGRRSRAPFPARAPGLGRYESIVTGALVAAYESAAPRALKRLFPNVRRIFSTMDPTLGVAVTWANYTGAELWLYAIDLHAEGYWAAGPVLRGHFLRRRKEAMDRADRVFALSEGMADWMRSAGLTRSVEILPPLVPVGDFQPFPSAPLTFLMSGAVYSVNVQPLRWVERAVRDIAPDAVLCLVTRDTPEQIRAAGLDPRMWQVTSVAPRDVPREVARATWTIVGMDSGRPDDALRVAWPTKLREYLGVGRPVLCVARPEYAVSRLVAGNRWGILATNEAETRTAVAQIVAEPRSTTEDRGRAAYAFAKLHVDDARVGAALRAGLLA